MEFDNDLYRLFNHSDVEKCHCGEHLIKNKDGFVSCANCGNLHVEEEKN